uniref:Sulfotransferase domain-containing protein n=1 Tax=Odontella aurita TaxID=265563 RepID=A0A7S4IYN5_9STRA|mmetsp:Transcript_33092/g.98442  ORF Transcript_33092/g.98442 Transcript_33092/m.98442 type:complete len:379 (+) Transcript_33092:270-1406(+)
MFVFELITFPRLRLTTRTILTIALAFCVCLCCYQNGQFARSLAPESISKDPGTGMTRSKVHTCHIGGGLETKVHVPTQPHFIIIGAQKCGTTSLFRYLIQHPNVHPPRNWIEEGSAEVHFFDFRIPTDRQHQFDTTDEFFCYVRKTYIQQYFYADVLLDAASNGTNLVSFEKTPRYLQEFSLVPGYITKTCPWLRKLIAVIRDPVDRSYSHYNMDRNIKGDPHGFERSILVELENMTTAGLIEWNYESMSFVPTVLPPEEEVEAFLGLPQKPQYVRRGLYEIQLREWSKMFSIPNELLVINYDDLRGNGAGTVFQRILDHISLPRYNISSGYDIHNSRPYTTPMLNRTRRLLQHFYEPYNTKLSLLLGEKWRDAWKYS